MECWKLLKCVIYPSFANRHINTLLFLEIMGFRRLSSKNLCELRKHKFCQCLQRPLWSPKFTKYTEPYHLNQNLSQKTYAWFSDSGFTKNGWNSNFGGRWHDTIGWWWIQKCDPFCGINELYSLGRCLEFSWMAFLQWETENTGCALCNSIMIYPKWSQSASIYTKQ